MQGDRGPQPRLTQAEKDTIKDGGIPTEWKPARCSQIDRDGRWTLKRGKKRKAPPNKGHQRQAEIAVPMFGYKNHIGVDRKILRAIADAFDVDIVSEHEPQFWGFNTQKEWAAAWQALAKEDAERSHEKPPEGVPF